MKKNIAILLSIITLFLMLFFLKVHINKPKSNLNGLKINEFIYQYDLETENLIINGFLVQDHEVYYLLMEIIDDTKNIYNYQLKKLNINTNEVTKINTLEKTNE